MSRKFLIVFGTRPEIIKLAPVYRALKSRGDTSVETCWTGQHIELADGLLEAFGIDVDYQCNEVVDKPTLPEKTGYMLDYLGKLLKSKRYDGIIVQGDTISAMAGAIAGFLHHLEVAHVEAGLRTHNLFSPWPEEFSRRVISVAGGVHFAPTSLAAENLRAEGISNRNILITGNTIVDAVQFIRRKIAVNFQPHCTDLMRLPKDKKLILVTGHRRENIGKPFLRVLKALQELAKDGDKLLIFPVHLNPAVRRAVDEHLGASPNIMLVPPLRYPDFIYLLERAHTVITDSGGIQEEAPCIRIPIIITRDSTERPEVIQAGFGKLVGTDTKLIVDWARMLSESRDPIRLSFGNPFGDGTAAERIASRLAGCEPQLERASSDAQTSLF